MDKHTIGMVGKSETQNQPRPRNYFVTLYTQNHKCLFGKMQESEVKLNACGLVVQECWYDLPLIHPQVQLDLFVLMPNHLHGLLNLSKLIRMPRLRIWDRNNRAGSTDTVDTILCEFMSVTSNFIHEEIGLHVSSIWNPEFEAEEISDEQRLESVRDFIIDNPFHWEKDPANPNASKHR